jgi:FixJ family two-component response regulator
VGPHLKRSETQIVIVDDDLQIRESLEGLLKSADFSATAFSCAEDALQSGLLVQASCLITDVRMPGMQGLELQRRVKREYPKLPVIIITGHRDRQIKQSALSEGAVLLLYKPFDPNDLLCAVHSAINHSAEDG